MSKQNFRVSLSISPYRMGFAAEGAAFTDGEGTARSAVELQQLFNRHGATEMWVRINTRRSGNQHAVENALESLQIAAELNMPVNPELMCVGNYMDMARQDSVDFTDYPEIVLPRAWDDCSLEDMCAALQQYGAIAAKDILATGCRVNVWDIGNETNFGFAGVSVGRKTAVNPKLEKADPMWIYPQPHLGAGWLAKNVWPHNARMMAAVAAGIRQVDPDAKVSVHIATAIADTHYVVKYFTTLMENGFRPDEAGISFYPSTPGVWFDQVKRLKKIISAVQHRCGLNTFIAEYAYPSSPMTEGEFKGWNRKTKGYEHSEDDQSRLLQELITWGAANGLSGIRPFAPDLNGHWEPMSLFRYDPATKVSTAKKALLDLK
ncbi:MAG: glycosyl hydrolase 53 family protein [Anaerolineaceae bacterium]|nr:glycosyl hydrolase 53 family protein [Anaerolineaceae bacterium]